MSAVRAPAQSPGALAQASTSTRSAGRAEPGDEEQRHRGAVVAQVGGHDLPPRVEVDVADQVEGHLGEIGDVHAGGARG